MKLISQLINDISRVFQKWFKYFNCAIILTSFVPSTPVLPDIFCLTLYEALLTGNLLIIPAPFKYGSSL